MSILKGYVVIIVLWAVVVGSSLQAQGLFAW